jgi:outer membrane receptor protein involved in Fe transport
MFGDKQQHNLSVNINNLLDKEYNTARQNIPQAGIHAVIGLNMAF